MYSKKVNELPMSLTVTYECAPYTVLFAPSRLLAYGST